jgi:hypothetical protein
MIALARFIMEGRSKAAVVAFFGNLLPLISPAAVALVALRQSIADTVLVVLWALLPLLIILYVRDVNSMMVWASIISVGVVLVGARALKSSTSWSQTLVVIVIASTVMALSLKSMMGVELEAMRAALLEMFEKIAEQQGQTIDLVPTDLFLTGLIAWAVALTAMAALILARWWQATLYNPGGFRDEFHALRLTPVLGIFLMVGVVACYALSSDYFAWGNLLGLPLLISGIAMVHHTVAFTGLGHHWLVFFYGALIFLAGPLSTVLVGLGFVDSMMDLRARLATRKTGS